MRVYALLLGIVLTTGYGYAAQVAVTSVGVGLRAASDPAATIAPSAGTGDVWYGGVLDPITVESAPADTHVVAGKHRVLHRQTVRCVEAAHSGFQAVS